MTERLGTLYHWSPSTRRRSIFVSGLSVLSKPTTSSGAGMPYVCLGPTPSAAWSISGDMSLVSEIEEWDLWQVRLADGDDLHVRPNFGPWIEEVKVYNSIPADRVWWVAQRIPLGESGA